MDLLCSNHCKVHVTTIQQAALSISGVTSRASGNDAPLAPAPLPRSKQAQLKYEPPLPGQEEQRNAMICETLANMINKSDSGWVDPSATKHKDWHLLCRYVPHGGLKQFILENQQFKIIENGAKRLFFRICSLNSDVKNRQLPAPGSAGAV